MALFEALSRVYCLETPNENKMAVRQDGWSADQDLNPRSSEYETEVLPLFTIMGTDAFQLAVSRRFY